MKKLLVILGVILLIIVVMVIIGIANLGPLVKTAVNRYGPGITQTKVHVADVGVSLFSGQAKLRDFVLGNPDRFTSPHALTVGSVYVDLEEKSVTSDTIIIDRIELTEPVISYEKVRGTDNFHAIIENVKRGGPKKRAQEKTAAHGPGKKLVIRDFVLKGGKVNLLVATPAGEHQASARMPDMHLRDLGGEEGITPQEAARQILAAIYRKVSSPAVTEALEKGREAVDEAVGAARGQAQQEVEKGREKVQEELDKTRKKIEGLLGNQ